LGDKALNDGDALQVACTVSKGDLPMQIKWFFNGKILTADDDDNGGGGGSNGVVSVSKLGPRASFLSIAAVGPSHSGNYTCQAENLGGVNAYTAALQVNGTILSSRQFGCLRLISCSSYSVYLCFM
jgi:hypothetical protein